MEQIGSFNSSVSCPHIPPDLIVKLNPLASGTKWRHSL